MWKLGETKRSSLATKLGIFVACLSLLILAGCGGLKPGGGSGSFGEVAGEIKNAATGLRVEEPVEVSIGNVKSTTDTGTYSLKNVPIGSRTLKAEADGYKPYARSINVLAGAIVANIELEPKETEITGIASAPADKQIGRAPRLWDQVAQFIAPTAQAAALTGEAVVENAVVTAYDWFTGELLAGPVFTDKNGKFKLTGIPAGAHIYIIVDTDDDRRLSTLVAGVEDGGVANVNTLTTLAAEAMGQLKGQGKGNEPIDDDLFAMLQSEILLKIGDISKVDLTPGAGTIPKEFGGSKGLDEDSVINQLRESVIEAAGPVKVAKRIVSEFLSLGPTIGVSVEPILMEAAVVFQNETMPGLQLIGEKLTEIVTILYQIDPGEIVVGREKTVEVDGYTVTFYLLEAPEEIGYLLPFIPVEVEITAAQDPDLKYAGSMTLEYDDSERLVGVEWIGEATDSDLLELAGSDGGQAPLRAEVMLRLAWLGDTPNAIYASGEIETPVLTMKGEFDLVLEEFDYGPPRYPEPCVCQAPKFLSLSGSLSVPGVIESARATFELETVQGAGTPMYSRFFIDGEFSIGDGDEMLLFADGAIDIRIPNAFELPLVEGETEELFVQVEVSITGKLKVPSRAPVDMMLEFERPKYGEIVATKLSYERGEFSLSGTGRLTLDGEGNFALLKIDLTESKGTKLFVEIDFAEDGVVDGYIEDVNGVKGATISGSLKGGVEVTYHLPNGETEVVFL